MPFAQSGLPDDHGVTDRKTFKRETSWIMLAFIGGLFAWGAGWDNQAATHAAEYLTTFVFLFAGGAFGFEGFRQLNEGLKR